MIDVICKKIVPPKPETRVVVTLDMTLDEAVELYHKLGKTTMGTPLAGEVRRALRLQGIE